MCLFFSETIYCFWRCLRVFIVIDHRYASYENDDVPKIYDSSVRGERLSSTVILLFYVFIPMYSTN